MASNAVKTATDANFNSDILKSTTPVLVDFWAEWCGPCKALGPTIDALADEYQGKVAVFKMNVDENPETPTQFGIRGIPTVLLFKGGQKVDQIVGAVPKSALEEMIKKHL